MSEHVPWQAARPERMPSAIATSSARRRRPLFIGYPPGGDEASAWERRPEVVHEPHAAEPLDASGEAPDRQPVPRLGDRHVGHRLVAEVMEPPRRLEHYRDQTPVRPDPCRDEVKGPLGVAD